MTFQISEKGDSPKGLSFGWQRAQLLGAFFNGVLLFGLGVSIILQSVERFISPHRGYSPRRVEWPSRADSMQMWRARE